MRNLKSEGGGIQIFLAVYSLLNSQGAVEGDHWNRLVDRGEDVILHVQAVILAERWSCTSS